MTALAPYNSYDSPDFVGRGYYVAIPFTCRDCGADSVWTAAEQKFWYEELKGFVYSTAIRCKECRKKERIRKQEEQLPKNQRTLSEN